MKHTFHPDAQAEFDEAAEFYGARRRELGLRFADAVEAAVMQACEAPTRWPILEDDVRCCLTKQFPYAILYSVERDFLLIVAVMHTSRRPGYWRNRVTSNG